MKPKGNDGESRLVDDIVSWPFASMDWTGKVTLCIDDGMVLSRGLAIALYPEFFPNNCEWPVNPTTGEELPMYRKDS